MPAAERLLARTPTTQGTTPRSGLVHAVRQPRTRQHRPLLIAPNLVPDLGDQEARWTMHTSPTENPGPGVIIFTPSGNAALDHLAASLAAQCDGSPTSIAHLLEHVLEADIEDLAESLSQASHPPQERQPSQPRCRRGRRGRPPGREPGRPGPPSPHRPGAARRRCGRHTRQRHHPLSRAPRTRSSPPPHRLGEPTPRPVHAGRRVDHAAAAIATHRERAAWSSWAAWSSVGRSDVPPDDPGGRPLPGYPQRCVRARRSPARSARLDP